jgi:hypothetical protein
MLREPRHTALGGDCRFRGKSLLHEREKICHASVFGDFAFSHAHDVDRIELNFASRRRDAQKFSQVRLDTLEATWRRIPVQASEARRSLPPGPSDRATYVNRTLYADVSFALRIRYLMSHDLASRLPATCRLPFAPARRRSTERRRLEAAIAAAQHGLTQHTERA